MSEAQFNADPNIKANIKTGVEAALTGITVDASTIVATDAAPARRRLSSPEPSPDASDLRRRLGANDEVQVSFEVETEVGTSDASTAFAAMTSELATRVADGTVSAQVNSAYSGGTLLDVLLVNHDFVKLLYKYRVLYNRYP